MSKKQLSKRIVQIISSTKGKFTHEQQKVLSQILDKSKSKRKTIFDMTFYDEILKWNFDEKLNQQYIEEEREEIRKKKMEEEKREEIRKRKVGEETGKIKEYKQNIKKDVKNKKISYILNYFDKLKLKVYCEMQSVNYKKQKNAIKKWDEIENVIEKLKNNPNDIEVEKLYAKIKMITENDLEK